MKHFSPLIAHSHRKETWAYSTHSPSRLKSPTLSITPVRHPPRGTEVQFGLSPDNLFDDCCVLGSSYGTPVLPVVCRIITAVYIIAVVGCAVYTTVTSTGLLDIWENSDHCFKQAVASLNWTERVWFEYNYVYCSLGAMQWNGEGSECLSR